MKEIKASDLRIGNLVNYKYYNPDPKAPDWSYEAVEIVEIKQSHLLFKHLNKKAKFKITVLYAIPLTEEWLLMLGGIDNEYTIEIGTIVFSWFSRILETKKRSGWSCDNYSHIKYVHELQNLYHALTGEELTINN